MAEGNGVTARVRVLEEFKSRQERRVDTMETRLRSVEERQAMVAGIATGMKVTLVFLAGNFLAVVGILVKVFT